MEKKIKLKSNHETREILGLHDEYLRAIEEEFGVQASVTGEYIKISGRSAGLKKAEEFILSLLRSLRQGQADMTRADFRVRMRDFEKNGASLRGDIPAERSDRRDKTKKDKSLPWGVSRSQAPRAIGPKTQGQKEYVDAIKEFDIVFGIGPAGTGKTYLAMAAAVEALATQQVRRIILTRPAIEAGESLGYLPGDMYEKISPYLRPLYDALYDMMDAERIDKYLETGIMEVAPLAYMRGRTLNDAFIILDEAQNCTAEQMKMFLTRLGFDSKAVITGDMTQSDLPEGKPIGLLQAEALLKDIEGIKFIYFSGLDVVRHCLVQRIIEAYNQERRDKGNHS